MQSKRAAELRIDFSTIEKYAVFLLPKLNENDCKYHK